MAPTTNGRLLFNSVPTGMSLLAYMVSYQCLSSLMHHLDYPEPGKTTVYDTTETIDLQTVILNGGILIKTLELSIDPYIRDRMREREDKPYSVNFGLFNYPLTINSNTYFRMRSCLASRACLKAYLLFLTPRFDNPTLFLFPFLTSRISNYGVGVVIRSEFSGVKAGDHIYGILREF